jgi:formylmethanofuran dehydrogenase subunit E
MTLLRRETILRQIEAECVDPIQEPITVEYDNRLQMPLSFQYLGQRFAISERLGTYRVGLYDPSIMYLVRAREGVFALYVDLDAPPYVNLGRGQWVLHFRVQEPEQETMLVDMKLKRAADFHGHLCPDLVIGYRASCYALQRLALDLFSATSLRVIAENNTSALDAIQHVTGCTIGNGRLVVHDHGKHAYTFVNSEGLGLRLLLKPEALPTAEFLDLEARLQTSTVTLHDTARFQVVLDTRVAALLQLSDEALFTLQSVTLEPPTDKLTSAMMNCAGCGELTAPTHLAVVDGQHLCPQCRDNS